jgi:hypothetical protein
MSWCLIHSGTCDQIFIIFGLIVAVLSLWGALSDETSDLSRVSHCQQYLVHCQKFNIIYIVHVTCFMYMQYTLRLCQQRLSTADDAGGSSYGRLSVDQFILVSGSPLGSMTRFYPYSFFSENRFVVFPVGRPLWREDGSSICSVIGVWSGPWGPWPYITVSSETVFPLRRLLRRYSDPPPHGVTADHSNLLSLYSLCAD